MHPPQWSCEELYKIHKQLRWGWLGQERNHPDDLNRGMFVLVRLYWRPDADRTYREVFDGPIYGRRWDRLERVPVLLASFSPMDVFQGSFIPVVRSWIERSLKERMVESARAKGRAYQDRLKDLAGEAGQFLYWRGQQTDVSSPPPTPKKLIPKADKQKAAGETLKGVADVYEKRVTRPGTGVPV